MLTIGHMAIFVVKSIVIQNDGQRYGCINWCDFLGNILWPLKNKYIIVCTLVENGNKHL